MDELIEELWFGGDYEKRKDFEQAIQTACKAQRNACARAYYEEYQVKYPIELIENAKIERCDYESNRRIV